MKIVAQDRIINSLPSKNSRVRRLTTTPVIETGRIISERRNQ